MSKKVCRECKMFVEKDVCPNDKTNKFTDNWKGKIVIIDVNKSEIAKKVGITAKGEYAIKIR
tara:strand:- start:333 stop:518 length:186 start_codon:yes stop_codon:yes gene_type:complete